MKFTLSLSLLLVFQSNGALQEPFPIGYSMINFCTIVQSDHISGRQPWIAACFANDTARWSVSSSYVNYYDGMDNLEDSDFRQAALGLWFNAQRLGFKASGTYFNALGIYEEWKGFFQSAHQSFHL